MPDKPFLTVCASIFKVGVSQVGEVCGYIKVERRGQKWSMEVGGGQPDTRTGQDKPVLTVGTEEGRKKENIISCVQKALLSPKQRLLT